jgi:E3 SUMO-protein ligase PIAS1
LNNLIDISVNMSHQPASADPNSNRSEALRFTIAKLNTFVINDLKRICRQEGLAVSGKKADLQQRIIKRLNDYRHSPTTESFDLLSMRIQRPHDTISPRSLPVSTPASSSLLPLHGSSMARGNIPSFTESPFYIKKAILGTCRLPTCLNNRHEQSTAITMSAEQLATLKRESNYRVLVYCADTLPTSSSPCNIEFPGQLEIRVNDQEVKANFKKVGKKDGSVKPADITAFVKKSGAPNSFRIVYARTTKVEDKLPLFKRKHCSGSCKPSASRVVCIFRSWIISF